MRNENDNISKGAYNGKLNIFIAHGSRNGSLVFVADAQLGDKHIVVLEEDMSKFLLKVYRPYLQSVVDNIYTRVESTEIISAMSVFDFTVFLVQKRSYQTTEWNRLRHSRTFIVLNKRSCRR